MVTGFFPAVGFTLIVIGLILILRAMGLLIEARAKRLSWKNYGRLGRKGAWEVDHSNPLSKGGTDYLRNLVPSCIECNRSKGNLRTREFENY